MIKDRLQQLIQQAFAACQREGIFEKTLSCPAIEIETPRQAEHGDLSTNVAMMLARLVKKSPRDVAQALIARFPSDPQVTAVRVAGAGFINFDITPSWYIEQLSEILAVGARYGTTTTYAGTSCQVEFVSANPTGPLHVGHGRGAILGDVLGNFLRAVGYTVTKEYYVNDAGVQIQTLGRSVLLRLRELEGESVEFPAECYQGDYIIDIARMVLDQGHWPDVQNQSAEQQCLWCGEFAAQFILEGIKKDLAECGVAHDHYFFESQLHDEGAIAKTLDRLRAAGHLYEKDGALWFRSTTFGDDKDRVIRKSDGALTYFAADIAYHAKKFDRNFARVVDVWGADHAGYVARMKAVVAALGHDPDALDCVMTQLVNLVQDGEVVSRSTRRGEYETLADLVDEVGSDVARYFYLMRSHNAQLDFDLKLATARTLDNPVYYIQYAHARICSIFEKCKAEGHRFDPKQLPTAAILALPEEVQLAKATGEYPALVELAARELEPHRMTFFLLELARKFQSYYTRGKPDARYRVLGQSAEVVQAKLYLLSCLQIVIRNGLTLLGISAPERMEREVEEKDEEIDA